MPEIIDPVHGSISLSELETKVVDSFPFQRLRKIKQLGNVHLVYPGAVHNRFSHSLGVMHVAGLLFTSIFRNHIDKVKSQNMISDYNKVYQIVRLAGLLHDIGHGPFSHHFENCLKNFNVGTSNFDKLTVEYLTADLSIPLDWISENQKNKFFKQKLSHEHYSFAVINTLIQKLNIAINPQDVCSLLCEEILPSEDFNKSLKSISEVLSKNSDPESLRCCLKWLLSGELDADRLDYLQRDTKFCGIKIAAIDIEHILNSINLNFDSNGNYFVELKRNCVLSVDQVLVSRKLMFDQVYNHRVNSSFDEMIMLSIDFLLRNKIIKAPQTMSDFLQMTDDWLESKLYDLAISKDANESCLAAQMFTTRSTLKVVHNKIVETHKVEAEVKTLNEISNKAIFLKTFKLKEYTKSSRDNIGGKNIDYLRIEPEVENTSAIPFNLESEFYRSTLWRNKSTRIVIFKTFQESSDLRKLNDKMIMVPGWVLQAPEQEMLQPASNSQLHQKK